MGTFTLHIKHDFSAARALRDYEGKCKNTHGHNFKVDVAINCEENDKGYAVDFYDVKGALVKISEPLDHGFLNETDLFRDVNPTTENIAKYFYTSLEETIASLGGQLVSVTVAEDDCFSASYSELT